MLVYSKPRQWNQAIVCSLDVCLHIDVYDPLNSFVLKP